MVFPFSSAKKKAFKTSKDDFFKPVDEVVSIKKQRLKSTSKRIRKRSAKLGKKVLINRVRIRPRI